jgi:hypothetical protein
MDQLLKAMWDYQKENGITRQCLTNTQYALDCIKANSLGVKAEAKAVIAVSIHEDVCEVIYGHLVVCIDDWILDPSYEIKSKPNVKYFDSIKSIKRCIDIPLDKDNIKDFIKFIKLADLMNTTDKAYVADKTFYNNQADAVELC